MTKLSFDHQLTEYESLEHQRRQNFLSRMEQKLEHKQSLAAQA